MPYPLEQTKRPSSASVGSGARFRRWAGRRQVEINGSRGPGRGAQCVARIASDHPPPPPRCCCGGCCLCSGLCPQRRTSSSWTASPTCPPTILTTFIATYGRGTVSLTKMMLHSKVNSRQSKTIDLLNAFYVTNSPCACGLSSIFLTIFTSLCDYCHSSYQGPLVRLPSRLH